MKEFNITDEQVQEMDKAEEPNDNYDCFFGCVTHKEGFVGILIIIQHVILFIWNINSK